MYRSGAEDVCGGERESIHRGGLLKLLLGFGGISMNSYVCGALTTRIQDGDKQGVFRDIIIMAMGQLVGRLRYSYYQLESTRYCLASPSPCILLWLMQPCGIGIGIRIPSRHHSS